MVSIRSHPKVILSFCGVPSKDVPAISVFLQEIRMESR